MNGKKVLGLLSSLVNVVLFTLLACMIFLVISSKASGGEPNILGYQLKTVLSGSMEPTFQTGSVIAIDPAIDKESMTKGDIITFVKEDDTLVTHRIMEVQGTGENASYVTKGDNNENADGESVMASNVVGEYSGFTVPYLGYAMTFANSQKGAVLLMIVPGVLLVLYSAFSIWRSIAALDRKEESSEAKAQ
ncbi:signal peptidase I SipW [Halobacillus halophilus]|uniref:signal peptidase I SipW n=1 Tax=Halobacillus halophilus TaxID=1570 RepID=UPI001CD37364|nr:signal peptidase I [Halobacillus halophilus]MCA1012282.1 signal peptidase I [Halobacillus halophilus]